MAKLNIKLKLAKIQPLRWSSDRRKQRPKRSCLYKEIVFEASSSLSVYVLTMVNMISFIREKTL